MGIFAKIMNQSSGEEIKIDMNDISTTGMVKENFSNSTSGNITEDTAMKIASLYQGVNIIADTIAAMPVYLYKDTDGFQEVFPLDSRSRALSGMSNEVLTAYNLKKNMVKDLILYGNAYAEIVPEGNNVKLNYYPPSVVQPKMDESGSYFFNLQGHSTDVAGERVSGKIIDYFDMLVLIRNAKHNSIIGQGLLDYAAQILDMSIQETDYMVNLFKNGLSAKAVLTSKTPFKKEVKEQLKADLKKFYSGANNSGKMLVLEGDISLVPLSLTPTDIKLIENKHFTISEIARFLNIPKHMLSLDRQQGTYSNITQERMQLLQNTLTPYVVAIEGALNQKLLTEDEINQGFYFQFNTSEMLKLTPEDNAKYMLDLYRENVVTLEEVRATLNLGGDAEIIEQLKKFDELKQTEINNSIEEKPSEIKSETVSEKKTETANINKKDDGKEE